MRNYLIIIVIIICLPLLYILSAFVTACILKNGFGVKDAPTWFMYIYFPVIFLLEQFPALRPIFDSIAKLFGV